MANLNTPYAILAFPTFFKAKPRSDDGEPVYSGIAIFKPQYQKTPAFKALKDACLAVAKEEWGEKLNPKEIKWPFRDGAEKAGKWNGFDEGDIFISPWSKSKPGIVNASRQDVLLPEEVWGGQLVRMNVTPYPWLNSGKKGVSFALNHVQIIRTDTPRIDGRGSAHDAFDDGQVDEQDEEAPF